MDKGGVGSLLTLINNLLEINELDLLIHQSALDLIVSVDRSFQTSHVDRVQDAFSRYKFMHYLFHRPRLSFFLFTSMHYLLKGIVFQCQFVDSQNEIVNTRPFASGQFGIYSA